MGDGPGIALNRPATEDADPCSESASHMAPPLAHLFEPATAKYIQRLSLFVRQHPHIVRCEDHAPTDIE